MRTITPFLLKLLQVAVLMHHDPVLFKEVLKWLPERASGRLLDVTAGGGGHFFGALRARPQWSGEAWDQDLAARARLEEAAGDVDAQRWAFRHRRFGEGTDERFDFILADIGVSSFQLDDPERGLSLHSERPPDFRMDVCAGESFPQWLARQNEESLTHIFNEYGEEPRARRAARSLLNAGPVELASAKALAEHLARSLGYHGSRRHPATRLFQALRIVINDELGQLKSLLSWAPARLSPGGRLAIISFHSLEDRLVKHRFRELTSEGSFALCTKRPEVPTEAELERNPRARSAKLRVLERALDLGP